MLRTKPVELNVIVGKGRMPVFSRHGVSVDPSHCQACRAYATSKEAFENFSLGY
jgi:hypothetical protein